MTAKLGDKPSLRTRMQRAVAAALVKLRFAELAYDVATYAPRGHVCFDCGRRSKTERSHLGHTCFHVEEL